MSITKNGNSPDSNGHSNGYTNGAMQYYQAGAAGGTPYGYYYDVAQAYQPGDAAVPSSQNETGGFAQGDSQDARSQGAFPTSPVYMQRFPSFQQGQEYQNFGGERQPVYGSPQNFAYAQGAVYQDPNQFMGSALGPQSNPLGSSSSADVIGRQQNMMGGAMSAAQTMPMLAGGIYQMGLNRGGIPVVSINDQTFAQMGPRGVGALSWADVAKVASKHQASVSATMPQLSPVMQPKVLSPGQPFALTPTALPPMFALNGQPRFVPGNLPMYGRGFPPPYQLLTLSSQSFPARGGRGFKGFTGPRGRGFGFPARGGFDSVLNQRYESGNERGPRAQRVRFGAPGGGEEDLSLEGGREQFNREDFDVAPLSAKFFVIKSYSEDDVHKSIKYGVWASTPNGNKRLQAAFREARETETGRVFLLFSVNASGQFCGVAEMIGDVDFDKSLDVWQQDKWNGQFKVQWHFVKDVPNGQFRHIILANNENKPVTNSRDTQEVPYDQGVEVLTIFKAFAAKTSILDDFAFYDNRQKQLQERREKTKQSRNQRRQKAAPEMRGDDDERNTSSTTDPTESGSEPAAEEAPRPSEDESLEERLAGLAVTSRPQEETEL